MAANDIAFAFLVEYGETNVPHEFSLQLKDADSNDAFPRGPERIAGVTCHRDAGGQGSRAQLAVA